MAFPDLRVQLALGSPSPLEPPDDVHIPGATSDNDLVTSGGTIPAWENTIDMRFDVQSSTWAPTLTQTIAWRYETGSAGAVDFFLQFTSTRQLRFTRRVSPGGGATESFDSPKIVQAADGDRILLRVTQQIQAVSGTNYIVVAFYQARGGDLFPAEEAWTSLGSVWSSEDPLSASGEVIMGLTDVDNASETTRTFGASWATTIDGTPILGLPQPIPAAQTTFTDEYSAGTTWGTSTQQSVALAPWTTVPDGDVAEVEWTAGRTDELATLQATSARVVLHNDERQWDPDNTSSPYRSGGATQLLPRVPLRIQTDTGAGWITQWTGFVDGGWDTRYRHPADGYVVLDCVDLLGVAADLPIGRDRYQDLVLGLQPILYLPMDEVLPDGTFLNLGSGAEIASTDGEPEPVTSLLPSRSGRALDFAQQGVQEGIELSGAPLAFPPVTFVFWYRTPSSTSARRLLSIGTTAGLGDNEMEFVFPNAGGDQDELQLTNDTGGNAATTVGGADDVRHFAAVTIPDTSGRTLWNQDGLVQSVSMSGGSFGAIPDTLAWRIGGTFIGASYIGVLDEFAVFDYPVDPDRVAALRTAAFVNQDVDERIQFLLDSAGVPGPLYTIEAGTYVQNVTSAAYRDRYLLGALGDTIATEQGLATVDHRAEVLRVSPRGWRDTPPAASLTITDEDIALTSTTARAESLTVIPNGVDTIINVVDVEWGDGDRQITTTLSDDGSVRAYGARARTLQTQASTLAAADGAAQTVLDRYAQPRTWVARAVLDVAATQNAASVATVLALETDDVVSVRRRPLDVGTTLTASQWVEAVRHRVIGVETWTVELITSPVAS